MSSAIDPTEVPISRRLSQTLIGLSGGMAALALAATTLGPLDAAIAQRAEIIRFSQATWLALPVAAAGLVLAFAGLSGWTSENDRLRRGVEIGVACVLVCALLAALVFPPRLTAARLESYGYLACDATAPSLGPPVLTLSRVGCDGVDATPSHP